MQIHEINVDYRDKVGTNSARRDRTTGQIPAVIYDATSNKTVGIHKKDIDSIVRNYGNNAIVNLKIGPENIRSMIAEVQYHPISNEIIHVDFKPVNEDTKVRTYVPIRFVGTSNIERHGAIIQKQAQKVEIECIADKVPKYIDVDLTQVSIGNNFKVQDIEIAEELSVVSKPEEVLATITSPSSYPEEEEEAKEHEYDNFSSEEEMET